MVTHDVVVIGGGIAGTLTALIAGIRGLDVAWVTDAPSVADQSAHWHGHLHRGRLYDPTREAALIGELTDNVPFWWDPAVRPFHAPVPTLALGAAGAWADSFGRLLGAGNGGRVVPPWLRDDQVALRTDEAIFRGPEFLAAAGTVASRTAERRHGRCTGIVRKRDRWEVRVAADDGAESTLRGRAVVVAAGIRTPDLVPAGVALDRGFGPRLSRMLVLRGSLPNVSAIVPARSSGGLFFAPREIPGGARNERVWLLSDGFSSPGTESPGALTDGWWACSILDRLAGFVRDDAFEDVRVGGYLAPKSRLAAPATHVPGNAIATARGLDGLVTLTPSKWSTSPTSAIEALDAVAADPMPQQDRLAAMADALAGAGSVRQTLREETWQAVATDVAWSDLRRPAAATLTVAAQMFGDLARPAPDPGVLAA